MHHHYHDITSRISDPVLWYDENAVPRYCEFGPQEVADIYADEVVLLLIECQNCRTRFRVAITENWGTYILHQMKYHGWDQIKDGEDPHKLSPEQETWFSEFGQKDPLAQYIREGGIGWGDPPNARCCPAGPTMSSEPLKVLQYWHKDEKYNWVRDSSLEIYVGGDDE